MKKLKDEDQNVQNAVLGLERQIQAERSKGKEIDSQIQGISQTMETSKRATDSLRQCTDCCHHQNVKTDKRVQQLRTDVNKELRHCEEARRLVQGDVANSDYFLQFSETLYGKLYNAWQDIARLESELLSTADATAYQASQPQMVMEVLQQQHTKFDMLCQHVAHLHSQADQLREQYLRVFVSRTEPEHDPFKIMDAAAQVTPAPSAATKLTWVPGQGGLQGPTFSGSSSASAPGFGFGPSGGGMGMGSSSSSASGMFGFGASSSAPMFGGFSSAAMGASSASLFGGFSSSAAPFGALGAPTTPAPTAPPGPFGFAPSMAAAGTPFGGTSSPFSIPSVPSPFGDANRPKPKAGKKKGR